MKRIFKGWIIKGERINDIISWNPDGILQIDGNFAPVKSIREIKEIDKDTNNIQSYKKIKVTIED